jgi:hypothetical protein
MNNTGVDARAASSLTENQQDIQHIKEEEA